MTFPYIKLRIVRTDKDGDNVRVAIMQPTYYGWAGYFSLLAEADVFVLLDNVKFEKQSWQQRNRIRNAQGVHWLTVPVKTKNRSGQLIGEVEINRTVNWRRAHIQAIKAAYAKAPFSKEYRDQLLTPLEEDWPNLLDLNTAIITVVRDVLEIGTPLVNASSLKVVGRREELLVNICRELQASSYLSPMGSFNYLGEATLFRDEKIDVFYQNYNPVRYPQVYEPFVGSLSVLDLVLNVGSRSLSVINAGLEGWLTPEEAAIRHVNQKR